MSGVVGDGRGVARYVGVTMREVGDWEHGEIALEGVADLKAHVATEASAVGTGALLTMCDNVAGFCAGLAALPDGWVQTVNLMVRRTRLEVEGPIRFVSTVLRQGRRSIVTDVNVSDPTGLMATGILTSAVMVPATGVPHWERPARLTGPTDLGASLPRFADWLGIRLALDGGVELEVFDEIRNPWGIVHGGVTASLIDAAAMSAVPGARGVVDATVDYLAPSKVGPLHARGEVIGVRVSDRLVRVEVRDVGLDRPTATAIVAVR